jgi:hypothetical protein
MEYALVRVRSSVLPHYLKPAMYSKGPLHCKDTIPKVQNKYSQERNREAAVPVHVSVSDLCIPLTGLPILLHAGKWAESGNIYIAHRHWEIGKLGLRPRNSFSEN